MLNAPEIKWEKLITPGIAIPTPWNKAQYDSMDIGYQKVRQQLNEQIARLKREGGNKSEITKLEEKAETLSRENAKEMDKILHGDKYFGKVGAFEGAGYSSKGLYRSMLDCIMFSKGKKPYCAVCENAVEKMIRHNAE